MAQDPATSVSFKQAKVISLTVKDGKIKGVFEAPVGEGDATISDFATLTADSFLGTLKISGREQQTALDFSKPPKED